MDVSSTARYLDVSQSWVRRHLAELPHCRVGRRLIRLKKKELDDYLRNTVHKIPSFTEVLPKIDLSLEAYDKMFLKWRTELKGQTRWTYGIGSVVLRKTKNKEARYYIDYQIDSRRIRKAVKGARTRAEAVKVLSSEIADAYRRKHQFKLERKDISFNEMADLFLTKYSMKKKKSWKTSDWVYIRTLKPFFGSYKLSEITPLMIEDYSSQRLDTGIKNCSVNRELSCLRKIFNVGIDWNFASENPVSKVKFFSEAESLRERVLTLDEERRLFMTNSPRLASILTVALSTGMRKGEILGLQWKNVSLEKGEIRVVESKSGRDRILPVNSILFEVLQVLKRQNGNNVFVFENPDTKKPYVDIKRSFSTACKQARIEDLRFHDLRHTFASRLVKRGVDLMIVKELLGHASVTTTQRYTHSRAEEKLRAVEALSQDPQSYANRCQTSVKYEQNYHHDQLVNGVFSVN